MFEMLNVKGKIITTDAMHCQRETCKKINRKGGEYVLMLKKNQPELFEDVKFYFDNEKLENFATLEKNHGRIEKRICRKMEDTKWLKKRHDWAIFAVERIISTLESMHWILDAVFGEDDCDFQSEQAHHNKCFSQGSHCFTQKISG